MALRGRPERSVVDSDSSECERGIENIGSYASTQELKDYKIPK
jgi:hypothetical protein